MSMGVNTIEEVCSPSPRLRMTGSSRRSHQSRKSLLNSGYHFNPLRFLATNLIGKNQERKELDRKLKMEEDMLNEEKIKIEKAEAEKRE